MWTGDGSQMRVWWVASSCGCPPQQYVNDGTNSSQALNNLIQNAKCQLFVLLRGNFIILQIVHQVCDKVGTAQRRENLIKTCKKKGFEELTPPEVQLI